MRAGLGVKPLLKDFTALVNRSILAGKTAFSDLTNSAKGAGLVGFNIALAYAAGTVGDALRFIAAGVGAVYRTLRDKMRDTVSAKDFGAVGDADFFSGVGTDDNAALQAALNSRGASGDRQLSVFLPDGTYYSSGDLIVQEGVGIFSNGPWRAKIHFAAGKGLKLVAGGAYDLPPSIRNVALYTPSGACVTITGISGAEVVGCWLAGNRGIEINGTADIDISGNVFDKTTEGIVFTASSLCNNVGIEGNSFTGNAYSIQVKYVRDLRIVGNAFRGDASHNIHILSPSGANTGISWLIHDNTFYTAPGVGAAGSLCLKLAGSALSDVSVQGNTLDGARGDAIICDSGAIDGLTVLGNTFKNIAGHCLNITSAVTAASLKANVARTAIGQAFLFWRSAGNFSAALNDIYAANGAGATGLGASVFDIDSAALAVIKGNTIKTTAPQYGIVVRSGVAADDVSDNYISGPTVSSYNFGNGSFEKSPKAMLMASATYDPPSLADGAGTTTTVGMAGLALGDFVAASFSADTQGITVTAWCSSNGVASVRFQNESGGTLDLASGTLRVRCTKA